MNLIVAIASMVVLCDTGIKAEALALDSRNLLALRSNVLQEIQAEENIGRTNNTWGRNSAFSQKVSERPTTLRSVAIEARRREALVIRTAVTMRGVHSTRARVTLPLDVLRADSRTPRSLFRLSGTALSPSSRSQN